MKKLKITALILTGFILTYFGTMTYRSLSVVDQLTELKTEHFVVSYHGIYKGDAEAVSNTLEENYNRVRVNLHDPDHEIVRIFIHPTQADFNKGTGLKNSNANGMSRGPNEFHLRWTNWFTSIFPNDPLKTAVHEFSHCVQLNILIQNAQQELPNQDNEQFNKLFEEKFIKEYPQWFWEALCDYEAGIVNKISVHYGMRKNPTLEYLNTSNQIYNVGYTIIEYVVERWGKDKLPLLITSYVDIEKVLKVSESDFEKGWIDFVNNKY
ncbi:MAG: hypothetical protein ABI663_18770 [Chryseolinea sp.]